MSENEYDPIPAAVEAAKEAAAAVIGPISQMLQEEQIKIVSAWAKDKPRRFLDRRTRSVAVFRPSIPAEPPKPGRTERPLRRGQPFTRRELAQLRRVMKVSRPATLRAWLMALPTEIGPEVWAQPIGEAVAKAAAFEADRERSRRRQPPVYGFPNATPGLAQMPRAQYERQQIRARKKIRAAAIAEMGGNGG